MYSTGEESSTDGGDDGGSGSDGGSSGGNACGGNEGLGDGIVTIGEGVLCVKTESSSSAATVMWTYAFTVIKVSALANLYVCI